ncbi:hypothetical protein [Streptomyces xantholiticus]|uniref:hypothetical protein n=1 Tax=Streptomyces xantholiticus TaxID=68285 RepID=UPI0019A88580|nr:hypothetical protein [Streptomyces xantholiticus]GGW69781.1 hypothetical protein GCM10010381_63190 [Streptomyces xantholiticus]
MGLGGVMVRGTLSDSLFILDALLSRDGRPTGLGDAFAHCGRIAVHLRRWLLPRSGPGMSM